MSINTIAIVIYQFFIMQMADTISEKRQLFLISFTTFTE